MRIWECQYNSETKELVYAYKHGCSDGFEDVKVIEYSAYEDMLRQRDDYKKTYDQLMLDIKEEKLSYKNTQDKIDKIALDALSKECDRLTKENEALRSTVIYYEGREP